MSRLDKLIEKFCPDGVEFCKLKDVAEIGTGSSDRKNATDDGIYPFYVRSKDILKINNYEFDEEAIVIPGEGGIGEIFHLVKGKYALHQRAYRIHLKKKDVLIGFLFHYMKSNFKAFINKKAVSATVTSIRKPMIEEFKLPVPPLEVQAEIVRILDNFTELEKELEKELELRRKQYEYYRDLLLDFRDVHAGGTNAYSVPWLADMLHELCPDGVEYKTLGKVAVKISDGMHNLPKGIREFGKYPILSAQNINKGMIFTETSKWVNREIFEIENRRTNVQKGDVLLTIVGAIGRTAVVEGELQALFQRSICVIKPDIKLINSRYIAYCLDSTDIQNYMTSNAHGAAQKGLYLKQVSEIKLPVPPLSVQQRIVDILDRFDALCNDLTSGLPAEIALRRKQYEYYRDKLLNFKELKVS